MLAAHTPRIDQAVALQLSESTGRQFPLLDTAQDICGRVAAAYCVATSDAGQAARLTATFSQLTLADMAGVGSLSAKTARHHTRLHEAEQACLDLLAELLRERRVQSYTGSPRDLIDVLTTTRPDQPVSVEYGARVLKTILTAARGIPGAALAWIIAEIADNHLLRDRIRSESAQLAQVVASGDPHHMPYTHAAVKEILRVHPPIWLLGRITAHTTHLDRWTITAGERVLASPYLIHHDPRWWTEPHHFAPERWLHTAAAHTHRHAYLPFGGGPRACLGSRLGLLQLTITAAHLARDYDIELIDHDHTDTQHSVLRAPRIRAARLHLREHAAPHQRDGTTHPTR
ncbi:cytochrome P450 [Nocardia sp. NPDC058480]|uniref:cytochrome P450 n=1 Tax=unclassified Nocardia TaxID=2637762 RepID=UPI0036537A54